MGQFPTEFSEAAKLLLRIPRQTVEKAVLPNIEIVAAHLDLEGFCYLKITRTGRDQCFSVDVTSQVLKGEEPASGKMTTKEISKHFWSKPAMDKDWDATTKKVRRS